MHSPLALSPNADVTVTPVGQERLPLVTVDNALEDIFLVRNIAARHSYKPIGPFYPGIRAAVSEQVSMPLVEPIVDLLRDSFSLPRRPAYFECYLSLVTKAPDTLDPIQRLPHFDGTERERLAVMLYLSNDEVGGTAFYRQRATGFESVDAARYDLYRSRLEAETAIHGLPPSGYIDAQSPLFERIHKVDGVRNRMIAYHGNALHCAALAEDFQPVSDPLDGRLTLNLFLTA